jgi:hypothetical protein
MRIFSSAARCSRVARRMLRTNVSDDPGLELDSVPQAAGFVSQVLKRDTALSLGYSDSKGQYPLEEPKGRDTTDTIDDKRLHMLLY